MKPIRLDLRADRELEGITDYYSIEKGKPEIAEDFSSEIAWIWELLSENPQMGTPIDHGLRSFTLDRFPYNVIYKDDPDRIYILAIAHHKQKPKYWLSRLD